jgi:hypothetical protein
MRGNIMGFFSNIFNGGNVSISSIDSGDININGKLYKGNSVSVINGVVIIDGKKQDGIQEKVANITINGNCGDIENGAGKVSVSGSASSINCGSGDVKCRDVNGSVKQDQAMLIVGVLAAMSKLVVVTFTENNLPSIIFVLFYNKNT